MHLSAHLDVDLVALEADDTVTVLLDLVAPTPRRPTPPAPSTPPSSCSTAPAPCAAAASSTPSARCSTWSTASTTATTSAWSRSTTRRRSSSRPAPSRQPAATQIRRRIAAVETGGMTDLSVRLPARPAGGPPGLRRAGATSCCSPTATPTPASPTRCSWARSPARRRRRRSPPRPSASAWATTRTCSPRSPPAATATTRSPSDADAAAAAVPAEVDGLLSKTVQAASLLIAPTATSGRHGAQRPALNPVEGGVMVELGDFYAAEKRRRASSSFAVPAMAALGLRAGRRPRR